jgi:hypothetical protein
MLSEHLSESRQILKEESGSIHDEGFVLAVTLSVLMWQ